MPQPELLAWPVRLTQKHLVYFGLVTWAVFSGFVLYIGYVGYSPVNRVTAGRIERGMTASQVETIFEGPCTLKFGIPARRAEERVIPKQTVMIWRQGRVQCIVMLDADERVDHVRFSELPAPGPIERIRALFRF